MPSNAERHAKIIRPGTYETIKKDKVAKKSPKILYLLCWKKWQRSLNPIRKELKTTDSKDSIKRMQKLPCSEYDRSARNKDKVNCLPQKTNTYIAHITGKLKSAELTKQPATPINSYQGYKVHEYKTGSR